MLRFGVTFTLLLTWAATSSVARAEEDPPRIEAPPAEGSAPAASASSAAPRADETVTACVKAAEGAQTERSAHRLRKSRQRLLACAQLSCPTVVRNDCATWLSEVDQLMPSVVVQARDTRGIELFDVRVLVDGELLTQRLDGLSIPVDPGSHLFQFEAEGAPPLQQQILVREGEKGRALPITLAAPAPHPAPAKPSRRAPPLTYVFGGLGVAGLAGFTFFGLKGLSGANELEETCGQQKTCTEAEVASVHRELVAADVSLAVGIVSLGAALYFYLSHEPNPPKTAVKPAVAVGPGMAHFSVAAPF